jgi:hypothetical protein
MANKALSKRQKLTIRIEPSQKAHRVPKPRNPVALAAKQRVAGPHKTSQGAQRQQEKRQIEKKLRTGIVEPEFESEAETQAAAKTDAESILAAKSGADNSE